MAIRIVVRHQESDTPMNNTVTIPKQVVVGIWKAKGYKQVAELCKRLKGGLNETVRD